MRKIVLVVCLFLISISQLILAQSESYGTWTSIDVEKKLDKWELGGSTELRTIYYLRLIDRWSVGLSADYKLMKNLKVGVDYQFMNTLDTKYMNYQLRNRFNVNAMGRLKIDRLTISLREKIQVTLKDDSNRIKTDGSIDTYDSNPEWTWRNRLKLSYNISHFPVTPSFSVESFYQLNNPDGYSFDKFRYTLSLDYKINKSNSISVYGVLNTKPDSDDIYRKYILGVSYIISF